MPSLTLDIYQESLTVFLTDVTVQDILYAPLDGELELDWNFLSRLWSSLTMPNGTEFIPLPRDFDWVTLAKMFRKGIARQLLMNPDLRPYTQTLMQMRIAEATERVASAMDRQLPSPGHLDLDRYAEVIKSAYCYITLGSLDSNWTQYERALRLQDVYVAQSVKEALPPRDMPRDYLALLKQDEIDT